MIALNIEDLKTFTASLFLGETFDGWLVREATVTTFNTFSIDGRIRPGYYTDQEREEAGIASYASWKMLRPFCCSLIRGKRLPESFRIVLLLDDEKKRQLGFSDEIGAYYLNIRYENQKLHCITGVSRNGFAMERGAEQMWDSWVPNYLKEEKLAFTVE